MEKEEQQKKDLFPLRSFPQVYFKNENVFLDGKSAIGLFYFRGSRHFACLRGLPVTSQVGFTTIDTVTFEKKEVKMPIWNLKIHQIYDCDEGSALVVSFARKLSISPIGPGFFTRPIYTYELEFPSQLVSPKGQEEDNGLMHGDLNFGVLRFREGKVTVAWESRPKGNCLTDIQLWVLRELSEEEQRQKPKPNECLHTICLNRVPKQFILKKLNEKNELLVIKQEPDSAVPMSFLIIDVLKGVQISYTLDKFPKEPYDSGVLVEVFIWDSNTLGCVVNPTIGANPLFRFLRRRTEHEILEFKETAGESVMNILESKDDLSWEYFEQDLKLETKNLIFEEVLQISYEYKAIIAQFAHPKCQTLIIFTPKCPEHPNTVIYRMLKINPTQYVFTNDMNIFGHFYSISMDNGAIAVQSKQLIKSVYINSKLGAYWICQQTGLTKKYSKSIIEDILALLPD